MPDYTEAHLKELTPGIYVLLQPCRHGEESVLEAKAKRGRVVSCLHEETLQSDIVPNIYCFVLTCLTVSVLYMYQDGGCL